MAKAEPKACLPISPAKDIQGDFAQFTNFMRKLVSVPRSEIQARLEAEKAAKISRASASGGTRR
jgi:hypothetical protein